MEYPRRSELAVYDPKVIDPPFFIQESGLVEISIERGKRLEIGLVKNILTKVETHPHGIKVELHTGSIGRVQRLVTSELEIKKYQLGGIKHSITAIKKAKVLLADVMTKLEGNEEERGIEFKETFRFDTKRARLQKAGRMKEADDRKKGESKILHDIEKEVSIAVAAFANTDGGKLEIGKKENEEGIGEISEYFEKDKKQYKNWDAYTNAITESIQKFTDDKPFVAQIKLERQNEKKFLKLHIPIATTPIFIHDDNKEEFYIRSMTARSQKLTRQSEIMKHLARRFPDWKGR